MATKSSYTLAGLSRPDTLSGPIGERVFAIKCCPTDGDVWIATNCGLARYSDSKQTWTYLTRADGLPSDQANALAFDNAGNLYVGTQCDGIAMASTADEYKAWRVAAAGGEAGRAGRNVMPTVAVGDGLPTNRINDLLLTHSGTLYAATTTGLAWSEDRGEQWHYVRGRDYADKVRGLHGGPPEGWIQSGGGFLAEDYCTCLAEDPGGLWIGHRDGGSELISPDFKKITIRSNIEFARTILPGLPVVCGTYGDGIIVGEESSVGSAVAANVSRTVSAPLPAGAAPPTVEELASLIDELKPAPSQNRPVRYIGEDWTTQGDWVGRYGRQFAVLCAARSPLDHEIQYIYPFSVNGELGPHHAKEDSLRRWVHWVRTENSRCLYDPIPGYRRQAEWDDHGEAYPEAYEGPDIWISLSVPAGTHCVSLYFMNKDGHDRISRRRDYLIEFKQYAPRLEEAEKTPTMAQARVRDFWGGVYPRFVVSGPAKFWLKIGKNYSLNTIVSAVFVDQLAGSPQPWDHGKLGWMGGVSFVPPDPDAPEALDVHLLDKVLSGEQLPAPAAPSTANLDILAQACRLWRGLDWADNPDDNCLPIYRDRVFAYRAAQLSGAREPLLTNWRWSLHLWKTNDRKQFTETMAKAHDSLVQLNPQMVGQDY